jgi:hypothetical protein
MAALEADAAFGWNVALVRRRQRQVNWFYYPTGLLGAVGAVIILADVRESLQRTVPVLGGVAGAVEFAVIAHAGFAAMSGLHGVFRWIVVVRAAVAGPELKWRPFPPPRYASLTMCYRISLILGFSFSLGALFVPTLFVISHNMPPLGRGLVWAFIVLLLTGGVLMFVVPTATLVSALAVAKRRYLDSFESPLGNLLDELAKRPLPDDPGSAQLTDAISRMMAIRETIVSTRLVPVGQTAGRIVLTIVIPVVSLVLSVLQTGLVHA